MSQYPSANNASGKLNDLPIWAVQSQTMETLNIWRQLLDQEGSLGLPTPSRCHRHPKGNTHLRDVETNSKHWMTKVFHQPCLQQILQISSRNHITNKEVYRCTSSRPLVDLVAEGCFTETGIGCQNGSLVARRTLVQHIHQRPEHWGNIMGWSCSHRTRLNMLEITRHLIWNNTLKQYFTILLFYSSKKMQYWWA